MVTVAWYGLEADDWSALEREVVDLFTALLRVDTTNPPGNETACALILKDYLAGNGIESTLVGETPERQNLVARLDGARPGPTLTYMGHMDVAPAARAAGAELRRLDPEVAALVEPLLGATFTPTMLDAGKAVNVIPTRAKACIDCRILPEMTAAGTRELVAAVLDPLGIDWEFEWVDVTTPNASPAPTALSESIARVLCRDVPDAVLAPMCSGSFTDSRWVREYFPDCIAYGFAPYVAESFHAMQGGRDHEPDERIRVEDVTYQALFFERLARDLLA